MSESNAVPTPPSSSRPNRTLDVVQEMIALCQRDLEALAQSLDYAATQGDIERAAQAVREIQAGSLLHGLDEIAILATEVEHALELNNSDSSIWQEACGRLVSHCRPTSEASGQAA